MSGLLQQDDLVPDHALTAGDADAFNHQAIAGRVAEIVRHTPTPANVALYGAWGSGKSSLCELLRRELEQTGKRIALVRYDAWNYGGRSLKRNFISRAATELGLPDGKKRNREFHKGLYQSTRSVDLRFGQLLKGEAGSIIKTGAVTLGAVFVSFVVFAAIAGWMTTGDAWAMVASWGAAWAPSLAGLLATLVTALKLLDVAQVEVDESAPSADEQFNRTFARLVKAARKRGRISRLDRIVFFVDELDRCSKVDVVETLTALRTFLDVDRCVFIVVGDRDVLEEALTELPQSTPSNKHSPYYSTASAFLDKIFQFQIALPPLRGGRLTRFARELVESRGGLWRELADQAGDDLNQVVYTLIPSHVRSPRRVKVLLNGFATNARVAESRGLDWRARATEIAKLTVFQTEFPVFASALVIEPKLPDYLLEGKLPARLPDRSLQVAKRYFGGENSDKMGHDVNQEDPFARLLASPADRGAILRSHKEQLLRYLERTARVASPGRDLLYLETAGASAGLEPTTGQALEDLAPEAPIKAIELAERLSVDQQQAALLFLAGMTEREFGVEQANVVDVMLGIASSLGANAATVALPVAKAIETYRQQGPLGEDLLAGALALGLMADEDALIAAVMLDDRLLTDGERVKRVASQLPRLDDAHKTLVAEAVAEHLAEDPSVLVEALAVIGADDGKWLLEQVRKAMVAHVQSLEEEGRQAGAVEFGEQAISAMGADSAALSVIWPLLAARSAAGYSLLREHHGILKKAKPQARTSHALLAIEQGPVEDWPVWGPMLAAPKREWSEQAERARRVLVRLIREAATLEKDELEIAMRITKQAVPIFRAGGDEAAEAVGTQLLESLTAGTWWADEGLYERQASLHGLARTLHSDWDALNSAVDDAREASLLRAVSSPAQMSSLGLVGLRLLSTGLPAAATTRLIERLDALATEVPANVRTEWARARIELRARLASAERTEIARVEPSDVLAAAGDYSDDGLTAIRQWLETRPRLAAAIELASSVSEVKTTRAARAFENWFELLSDEQRTKFLLGLWERGKRHHEWILQLQRFGLRELETAELLATGVERAARAEERTEAIGRLLALAPQDARAQRRVADMVIWLLGPHKVDKQLAIRAAPALGKGHRSKRRLVTALKAALTEHDMKLTESQARSLGAAGLRVPKRLLAKRALALNMEED